MSIQYGAILHWPGRLRDPYQRTRAPFKSGHDSTLMMLEKELRMISAESAVVQLALGVCQFTQDGRPYYRATPSHPGVIVSFAKPIRLCGETKPRKVPLMFPADKFLTWETNLRAVAIALEDLRRIDRYGVTQTAEQYTGFKALPGPMSAMPTMTVDEAATWIATQAAPLVDHIEDADIRVRAKAAGAGGVLRDRGVFDSLYRLAAKRLHPDANRADPQGMEKWMKLQEASRLLETIHSPTASAGEATRL